MLKNKKTEEELSQITKVSLYYNNKDQVNSFTFGDDTNNFIRSRDPEDVITGMWEVHGDQDEVMEVTTWCLDNLDTFIQNQPNEIVCDCTNKFGYYGMRSFFLKFVIDHFHSEDGDGLDPKWIPVEGYPNISSKSDETDGSGKWGIHENMEYGLDRIVKDGNGVLHYEDGKIVKDELTHLVWSKKDDPDFKLYI